MVSPSRSSTSRRRRDDAGKLFIGALILLGLVASVFLVFSNSLQYIRIGLMAALWAAMIGALAATKYRKDATVDKAKVRDLRTVYELQLEREVTARREYELGVEARVREEVGADAAEMAALRAELTVLRESLQRLFDGDLPVDRPALHADSTRIPELPGAPSYPANDSSENANVWSMPTTQQPPSSVTPVFVPEHPAPPMFASPFDEPVTAETSVVPLEFEYTESEITDVDMAPTSWADAFTEPEPPKAAPPSKATPPPRLPPPPKAAMPDPVQQVGSASSRRRRREADDMPSRRLSVAEIMANLQSEEERR